MKIDLTITVLDNGIVIHDEDKQQPLFTCYTFDVDNPSARDVDLIQEMIGDIFERIGYVNHKFNQYDVVTNVQHGSHYICKDEHCEICNPKSFYDY